MKNSIAKLGKRVFILVGIIILFFLSFLLYIHFTDYQPAAKKQLFVNNSIKEAADNQTTYTMLSWNLGYCGLGKEMDFFHEGGKQVRPDKFLFQKYLKGCFAFIESMDDMDFFFFQEVDKSSKRSYYFDQSEMLSDLLVDYNSVFAYNYKVPFVPIPLFSPMGHVEAGLMTFSRAHPIESTRYAYPNIASWPNNLFLLDRCFILSRYALPSGKELVLMNTHNSYYVMDDSLRMLELNILKNKMIQEYNLGNYVIAGGDWNKCPPNFIEQTSISSDLLQSNVHPLDTDFLAEDWIYAFDPASPSNRDLVAPYVEGKTKWAVIDFFVVSPNVQVKNCETISLGFEYSDHNPVRFEFSLILE